MSLQIDVPGHPRWLALPLTGDVDAEAQAYAERLFDGPVEPDVLAATVAVVAGTARVARRSAEDGPPTAMAWTLLPERGPVAPGPLALLRYLPFRATGSDDDLVELLLDPAEEVWGPVEVDDLETASGRALALRFRPVVVRGGVREVHELRAALWPGRDQGLAVVLSSYVVDLLLGAQVAEPFDELARSVRWSGA